MGFLTDRINNKLEKCKLINEHVLNHEPVPLQSNQVKPTPQEYINEFIIQKLNPLLVVDFRFISAVLHV